MSWANAKCLQSTPDRISHAPTQAPERVDEAAVEEFKIEGLPVRLFLVQPGLPMARRVLLVIKRR